MMLARVLSCMSVGIDASIVEVEVDMVFGLPMFTIVGLPDTAVRESRERVRAALRNAGFKFPPKKITINLAPANVKKEGALYDLPVAIAILCAEGIIEKERLSDMMLMGELSLDGYVRPIRGALSIAIAARERGLRGLLIPYESAVEAALITGIHVYGVETLSQVIAFLNGHTDIAPVRTDIDQVMAGCHKYEEDILEVKGQEYAKRAMEVAAAGGHNLLMIGPPGSGKTMLAKRLPTIMPDITYFEAIETTRVYSLTGGTNREKPMFARRPFRAPHHTISYAGMAGGGRIPKPGEISLAHNGVLFIDEVPEYRRDVLEVLRQPVEDRHITVSRAGSSVTYPARFMLVCAMNPCPCGYFTDPVRACLCTPLQIQRYRSRLSGPLLDRIDIQISLPPVTLKEVRAGRGGSNSSEIRKRVNRAREIQCERYCSESPAIISNSEIKGIQLQKYCKIDHRSQEILEKAISKFGISMRAYDKILRVARTIADLDEREEILSQDISEAIGYRALDRNIIM